MSEKEVTKTKKGLLFAKIGLILAVTVIACNFTQLTIASNLSRRKIAEQSEVQYKALCRQASESYANLMAEYIGYMTFYSNSDVIRSNASSQEIYAWLKSPSVVSVRNDFFAYVAWVEANGDSHIDIRKGSNVSTRDYFQAIMSGKDFFIDNPVPAKATGKLAVHVCTAAKRNGKTIGLFYGNIDPTTLSDTLNELNLGNVGSAVIYGSNGELIGTNTSDDGKFKESIIALKDTDPDAYNAIEKAWKANSTYEAEIKINGKKSLVLSEPIKNTPWKFILFLEEEKIFETSTTITRVLSIGSVISILLIIIIAGFFIYTSLKPLKTVENSIKDISTGDADLTKRIDLDINNEIGRVVDGFNLFSEKLQTIISTMKKSKEELLSAGDLLKCSTEDTSNCIVEIISKINSMENQVGVQTDSVTQTAGAVNQIASNIDSLNNMIDHQARAVSDASCAVEEMIGNINSVNASVAKMAESFGKLEEKAAEGVKTQNEVNEMITEIEKESQTLQEANTVISNIAEQTNLLAMNAAIEAAHAGETGKGFSVVADEIRKLSEDSSTQSQSIGKQLKRISTTIQNIVGSAQNATAAFTEVTDMINNTNALVQEINHAMQEQNEGSRQISQALQSMNDTSNEVKVASVEMAEGNKTILEEIRNLQDASLKIRDEMDNMSSGATKIQETGTALTDLSQQMENSILQIGEQVDQFKV